MDRKDLDDKSTLSQDESLTSNNDELSNESDSRGTRNPTKIARIRSFKEDFLEKISQIRTPTNTISRSHSPKTKNTHHPPIKIEPSKQSFDLNYHAKQVKSSLTHFKDVVSKNKLEMLHGNLTILLQDIANVKVALKALKVTDTSAIISATSGLYLNLASLIKLCDEALISENADDYISLNKGSVEECIENIETSVVSLVSLASQRKVEGPKHLLVDSDHQSSRSSLPDIPLTKDQKLELENSLLMHNSQSSDSLFQTTDPPPKPAKEQFRSAPPLPPKKKNTSIDETRNEAFMQNNFNRESIENTRDSDVISAFDTSDKLILRSHSVNSREYLRSFQSRDEIDFKEDMPNVSNFNFNEFESGLSHISFVSQNQCYDRSTITNNENILPLSPFEESSPPPLPIKMRTRSLRLEHHKSVYDNVDSFQRNSFETASSEHVMVSTTNSSNSSLSTLSARTTGFSTSEFHHTSLKDKYKSCIESSTTSFANNCNPPPLPLKKKHIMAYMQIFGNATGPSSRQEPLMRHSMHSFSQSSKLECSFECQNDFMPKKPPALPPKKQKSSQSNSSLNISPPTSPVQKSIEAAVQLKIPDQLENQVFDNDQPEVVLRKKSNEEPKFSNLMEELEVQDQLVFRRDSDNASVLLGGSVDSLIIYATKNTTQRGSEAFAEAFLLTYRTFIEPFVLIEKLIYRYNFFSQQNNDTKQKAAKEAFSLLVRVVNDLTSPDLVDQQILEKLVVFVYELVCAGELLIAKLLREKIIEKTMCFKESFNIGPLFLPSRPICSNPPTLIELKSVDIAEQMTILDAELFHKIEVPEILIWAEQQNEEKSKNLTKFTEHFNKLSYWTRTQILKQQDAKDREKHVMKFIKIMKHLRKINNFNSYLALLSALDSAPIRRLEWQKHITEGLKEYCALIDSSSSFRAYRLALSETTPPCIPYIGLVLQDLTFVHIGNPNILEDGSVNFSKRWQQSALILNMKKFRTCSYSFKKNEKILAFFDNFDDYFDEDQMWQISEKIKPRGKK